MEFETFKRYCMNIQSVFWSWSDDDDMLIFSKLFQVDDLSGSDDLMLDEDFEEPLDVALCDHPDKKRTVKLEIHILYSIIWQAPDIYLNASWQDNGEILSIDTFCHLINKPVPKLLTKRVCCLIKCIATSSNQHTILQSSLVSLSRFDAEGEITESVYDLVECS